MTDATSTVSPRPAPVRQAVLLIAGAAFLAVLAAVLAVSLRAIVHAGAADVILLEGFELVVGMLFLGSLALVAMGVLLQFLLPERFGHEAFAAARLHELYDAWELRHYSVEDVRDHARNPYRSLPSLELCDVADQVDREAFPEVWADVAHEIKNRIEALEPVRIG